MVRIMGLSQGGDELTLEEGSNALLDSRHSAAGAVGTDGADMLEQALGALNDIGLVPEVVDQDMLVLEQLGIPRAGCRPGGRR